MKKGSTAGFTLIETMIYLALFALIMAGVLPAVYMVLQSSSQLGGNTTTQMERDLVMRKIDWALGGAQTVSSPSSGVPSAGTLSLDRYDGTHVDIQLNGSLVQMREAASGAYTPITTSNVSVSALHFEYIAPSGSGPSGITAYMTIDGEEASTTRYTRI